MRVLVTGGGGFVGPAVCEALAARGHQPVAALRRPVPGFRFEIVPSPDLGPEADWSTALAGCEAVIHLAGRAHVMKDAEPDPLAVFRRVNTEGTLRLARQAAQLGVRRLIFVSSIKVNGEATPPDRPFTADDAPAPLDPYGISKAEAEAGLADAGLDTVVVRPPLVHGPGAKGNLATLMAVLRRGIPLPLGAIDNRRSLVGVANLGDALAFLADHPGAAGRTFLIRDGDDVSTPQLLRLLGVLLGRPARLFSVPVPLLRLAGMLAARRAAVARLTGSLVVEDEPLRRLGWTPPHSLADGLAAMVRGCHDLGDGGR
ncbi:MAG: NAD-dependent epimerase/dehydratase family protein [Pseudomonadota bacterium]